MWIWTIYHDYCLFVSSLPSKFYIEWMKHVLDSVVESGWGGQTISVSAIKYLMFRFSNLKIDFMFTKTKVCLTCYIRYDRIN